MNWQTVAERLDLRHAREGNVDFVFGDHTGLEILLHSRPLESAAQVTLVLRFGVGADFHSLPQRLNQHAERLRGAASCAIKLSNISENWNAIGILLWLTGPVGLPTRKLDFESMTDFIASLADTLVSLVPSSEYGCWGCGTPNVEMSLEKGAVSRFCLECAPLHSDEAEMPEPPNYFTDVDEERFQCISARLRRIYQRRGVASLHGIAWLVLGWTAATMTIISWFFRLEVFLSIRLLLDFLGGCLCGEKVDGVDVEPEAAPSLFALLDVREKIAPPRCLTVTADARVECGPKAVKLGVAAIDCLNREELAFQLFQDAHRRRRRSWISAVLDRMAKGWTRLTSTLRRVDDGDTAFARFGPWYLARVHLHACAVQQNLELQADRHALENTTTETAFCAISKMAVAEQRLAGYPATLKKRAQSDEPPCPYPLREAFNELNGDFTELLEIKTRWFDLRPSLSDRLANLDLDRFKSDPPTSTNAPALNQTDEYTKVRDAVISKAERPLVILLGRARAAYLRRLRREEILRRRLHEGLESTPLLLELASLSVDDPQEAIKLYERALQLDPDHGTGRLDLIKLCASIDDWSRVRAHSDVMRKADPEDAVGNYYYVLALSHLEEKEDAEDLASQLLASKTLPAGARQKLREALRRT